MKRNPDIQQMLTDAMIVSGELAFLDAAEIVQKLRKECTQVRFIKVLVRSHKGMTRKDQRYVAGLLQTGSHCVLNRLEEDFLNRSKDLSDLKGKKL